MKELTVKALDEMIDQIIKDNKAEITKNLFLGGNDSMSSEEVYALMAVNCLSLSIKLSVQVVFESLQSQGVLEIDDREIAKLYLKHLSFDKED